MVWEFGGIRAETPAPPGPTAGLSKGRRCAICTPVTNRCRPPFLVTAAPAAEPLASTLVPEKPPPRHGEESQSRRPHPTSALHLSHCILSGPLGT